MSEPTVKSETASRAGESRAGAQTRGVPSPAPSGHDVGNKADHQKHLSTDHLLKNLKGRTISGGLVTVISQGFQFALNMASLTILARLLTPRDFGLVAMVMTIMSFLQVFKDAGLSAATVQKEGITQAQVSNLFWVNIGLSGAVTLCVACSAPLIAWFYGEPRLIPITLALSLTFVLSGSSVQHLALLNRRMQFKTIALIQVGSMSIGVAIGLGMAWLNYGYWSLVGLNMGTALSTFAFTWMFSPWRPQFFTRRSKTRPLLNFGASLAAGTFLHNLSRGTDSLLVGRFFGADAIGIYSRGTVLLIRPLDQIMVALNSVFVPALSRLQTQPERYRLAFLKVFEAIALVSFPLTALLLALAHPLTLVLLGPKWDKAAVIFACFTLVAVFYPLNNVASWLFATQGRGRESLVGFSISSVIAVMSFVVGLPFGPAGIAGSYSIACLVLLLPIRFYIAGRRGPVNTADLWIGFLRYLPLWIVVWVVTGLMRATVANASPFKQLILCAPVGLGATVIFLCLIAPYRRRAVALLGAFGDFKKFRGRA